MSGAQCLSRRFINKIPFVMLFRNSRAGPVAEYTLIMHQRGETTPHPSFVGTVPDFLWQKGFPWLPFPGPCQISTGSNRADEWPCHDGSGALVVTSWGWQSISPTHSHSVPQGKLDRLVSAQGMQRLRISPSWCTRAYTNFYFLYFLLKSKQLGS